MFRDNDGCLIWVILGVGLLLGMFIMAGPDTPSGTGGTSTTTTNTTTSVQVNLFSAVNNGRVLSNDATNTNAQTTVNGDHAQVSTDAVGNRMCWDNASQQYVYACPQVTP